MKKVILSVFAVVLFVLACGETGSPEGTVDRFLQALRDKDKEAALMTIYSGNQETDMQERFYDMWGDVESGAVSVEEWTEPKLTKSEEVSEEGVDVLEVARVETEVTIVQDGQKDTEKVTFEVVRNEFGWFVFEMEG
ncbi:MAG TPA: hypothetical protein VM054_04700 [bacterium]|nr:hypothetical protein [bacterium]